MKYRTIVADPPWPIRDLRRREWAGAGGRRRRASARPYDTMSIETICALPVAALAEDDAHLFLWVPAEINREGLGVRVARAWGFAPLNEIIWMKPNFGLGRFPRPQHEILLIGRRGRARFVGAHNIGSVQRWAVTYGPNNGGKRHSRKPEGAQDLIEQASPGPYLELFARRRRLNWSTWGNETHCNVQMVVAEGT